MGYGPGQILTRIGGIQVCGKNHLLSQDVINSAFVNCLVNSSSFSRPWHMERRPNRSARVSRISSWADPVELLLGQAGGLDIDIESATTLEGADVSARWYHQTGGSQLSSELVVDRFEDRVNAWFLRLRILRLRCADRLVASQGGLSLCA